MTTFRLVIGRWARPLGFGYDPQIEWRESSGLDMPDRAVLEDLAIHVLRMPGVVAVRIDEIETTGTGMPQLVRFPEERTAQ